MLLSKIYIFKRAFYTIFFLIILFSSNNIIAQTNEIRTVVIDPGHGGKHPGAISSNKKYMEKNITLSIGLKLGNLIKNNYPGIKVLYTRTTDKFVDFDERAAIANKNKADLFISIHVNSTKNTSVKGSETFVMGIHKSDENFEVCKTENSVIVMEDDYKTKYEGFNPDSPESYIIFSLLQNTNLEQSLLFASHVQNQFKKGPIYNNRGVKQGGLLVLWKTTMPAVLTEVGFISNSSDLQTLITQQGQQSIAKRLFDAFTAYKIDYEQGTATIPIPKEDTQKNNDVSTSFYSIQILSVTKPLKSNAPDLKGRKDASYIKVGNLYKYYIGNYKTRTEASNFLKSIKKTFPGAFVINIKDNKIIK